MYSPDTYHPVAWLVWLLAAALPALTTRNPLYLGLALLAGPGIMLLAESARRGLDRAERSRGSVMFLSLMLAATAAVAWVAFRPMMPLGRKGIRRRLVGVGAGDVEPVDGLPL